MQKYQNRENNFFKSQLNKHTKGGKEHCKQCEKKQDTQKNQAEILGIKMYQLKLRTQWTA